MRVVLDTNVFVSAFLTGGDCEKIIRLWQKGKFVLLISAPIAEEIARVLSRLGASSRQVLRVMRLLRQRGKLVKSDPALSICRDPDDDKFIECAIAGKADVIVSGDRDLLVIEKYKSIRIMSIKNFLAEYGQ
ncbi:MAG: putative toxin-antitoxin system toxin component, PIN family [bacterium]